MSQPIQKIRIREITRFSVRVYKAVLELLPQLDPVAELPDESYFRKILRSQNSHFFIAELSNGQIAGMLTIGIYCIPTGMKVWIEDVVVDASQRGKGYGEDLTLFAIKFAKSIGAKTIDLTSKPSRISANKLYKKSGFELRETNVYKYLIR